MKLNSTRKRISSGKTYASRPGLAEMHNNQKNDSMLRILKEHSIDEKDLCFLAKIKDFCKEKKIDLADVGDLLDRYLSEKFNHEKEKYETSLETLWKEKKAVDIMSAELESISKLFNHKRGVFYVLSVFMENIRNSNGVLDEVFIKKMSGIRDKLENVMLLYGSFNECMEYSFCINDVNSFNFESYVEFSGIGVSETPTIDEYEKLNNQIDDLIQTQEKNKENNESYAFYKKLWNECYGVINDILNVFDEDNVAKLTREELGKNIDNIIADIKVAFEKCDVEFVFYSLEKDNFFTHDEAMNKAAVYNKQLDVLLQLGNCFKKRGEPG